MLHQYDMPPLSSYTPTGRQQLGPASDLLEMQDARGEIFTAIRFHPEYRSHNAINSALFVVLSFLESPMVSGLSDLVAYDLEGSTFLYATGKSWSIAEIVQLLGDQGQAAGPRAAAELMAAAGNILVEAAEIGESAGVYSHGGLTPWRVVTSATGKVQIIGHALPQVEILALQQDPTRMPGADAFRYCPPERLDGRKENFSSDLFGLALAVFELVTGKPLYNGLVDEIRQQAARAETGMRLQQAAEVVPEPLRALLRQALRPTIPDRFRSGGDFQTAMDAVLRAPLPGPSLKEIMQRASRIQPRARQELQAQSTQQFNRDKLKAFLAEAGVDPQELQSPVRRTVEPARPAEPPPSNRVTPLEPQRTVDPAVAALSASGMRRAGPPPDRRSLPPEGREAESLAALPPPRTPPSRATEVRPPDPSASSASLRAGPPPARAAEPPPARAVEPPRPPDAGPPRGARPNPRQSMSLGPGSSLSGAPTAEAPPEAPRPPEPVRPAEPMRPPVGVARTPPSRQSLEPRPPFADPLPRTLPPPPEAPARPPAASPTPAEPPPRPPGLPPPPPVGTAGGGLADLLSMVQPAARPAAPTTPPPPPPFGGLRTLSPEATAARTVAPSTPPLPGGTSANISAPPTIVPTGVPTSPPLSPPAPPVPAGPAAAAPVPAAPPSPPPVRAPGPMPAPVATDDPAPVPMVFSSSLAEPPTTSAPATPPAPPSLTAPATAPRPAPISTAPPASAPRPPPTAPTAPRTPVDEPEVTAPEAKVDADQTRVMPLRAAAPPAPPRPVPTAPPTPVAPVATPAPVASVATVAPVVPPQVVPPPTAPAAPAPRLGRHRVADNPRPTTGGNVGTYKVSRAPGMPVQQYRLPTGATLAEAAATLIGRMIPARVGLDGRLLGWYRLGGSNGPLPADLKLESVSPDEVLYLHFVPGRSLWASVETAEGQRLRTPVHTAVPMSWLVDGAAELLDLPAGDWQIFLDGVMLGPHHILEDRNPGGELRLVLRRT